MSAEFPIARVRHLRRNTLVNLETAFARLRRLKVSKSKKNSYRCNDASLVKGHREQRKDLHERGFILTRFHAFETASKSIRFGSVYTESFSPENQSCYGISERYTKC